MYHKNNLKIENTNFALVPSVMAVKYVRVHGLFAINSFSIFSSSFWTARTIRLHSLSPRQLTDMSGTLQDRTGCFVNRPKERGRSRDACRWAWTGESNDRCRLEFSSSSSIADCAEQLETGGEQVLSGAGKHGAVMTATCADSYCSV